MTVCPTDVGIINIIRSGPLLFFAKLEAELTTLVACCDTGWPNCHARFGFTTSHLAKKMSFGAVHHGACDWSVTLHDLISVLASTTSRRPGAQPPNLAREKERNDRRKRSFNDGAPGEDHDTLLND